MMYMKTSNCSALMFPETQPTKNHTGKKYRRCTETNEIPNEEKW
jgi:hypothetical protein